MTGTIIEDFEKTFDKTKLDDVLDHAYEHSDLSSVEVPKDKTQRLFFSLLKMIDFECFAYDHAPEGLTLLNVKKWLVKHKDEIKCEPPSMLGMFAGAFNFLAAKKTQ